MSLPDLSHFVLETSLLGEWVSISFSEVSSPRLVFLNTFLTSFRRSGVILICGKAS